MPNAVTGGAQVTRENVPPLWTSREIERGSLFTSKQMSSLLSHCSKGFEESGLALL